MAIVKTNSQNYSSIANAIRAKGVSGTFYPSEMATAISNIPTGSSGIPDRGVVFIDYDGTVVAAWDASEVASKTALPANPTGHTRLVADGWNWSLTNIKNYIQKYPRTKLCIMQMYHTASGFTEFDIVINKKTGKTVDCYMEGTKDWGDGTTNTATTHNYNNYGQYTIVCHGTVVPGNRGAGYPSGVFYSTNSISNKNRYWCTAVRIGSNVTSIGQFAFMYCVNIKTVIISKGVSQFSTDVFRECSSLSYASIPDSVSFSGSGGYSLFRDCDLKESCLPDSVVDLPDTLFYQCKSLSIPVIPDGISIIPTQFIYNANINRITIPNSVTTIKQYAFYGSNYAIEYDFSSHQSVPTLENANAFSDINYLCRIIVPDALYNSWIVATNWSTYADHIYKASEVTD